MAASYAIIPAAGRSARMGAAKLLLPVGDATLIDLVLRAWIPSRVSRIVVVVRGDDLPLRQRCQAYDVDLVAAPASTPDMKASVQCGLQHIARHYAPALVDAFLVAPADLPELSPALIDQVLRAYDPFRPAPVVPVAAGRRGHPLLLPWSLAPLVFALTPEQGVNALLDRLPHQEVQWPAAASFDDLDAPADLDRLSRPTPRAPTPTRPI
ncbi:MAG: NTP transferase domain-containing protein [Pirellulales bacterium]|nr:NTP transferase domain-containing protein [Pirellulales bacterium]